jgi:hypothetical protein
LPGDGELERVLFPLADAAQRHSTGELESVLASPFRSWTHRFPRVWAQRDSNIVIAEIPVDALIVNIFNTHFEAEVLTTALNPEQIACVFRGDLPSKLDFDDFIGRTNRVKSVEELETSCPWGEVVYHREQLRVKSRAYGVEGLGNDAVLELLELEKDKTVLDHELKKQGLEKVLSRPFPWTLGQPCVHPLHGELVLSELTQSPEPHYGVPFSVTTARFRKYGQAEMIELPVVRTRRNHFFFLERNTKS